MPFDLPGPGVYFSLWSKVDQILCSPILVHFVFSIWRVAVVIIIHIFPSHCPVHLNPLPMPLVMVLLIFQNVTSIGAACIPTSFHWVALPQWHWGRIIENDSRRFVVLIITILSTCTATGQSASPQPTRWPGCRTGQTRRCSEGSSGCKQVSMTTF